MTATIGIGLIGAGRMGRVHADVLARDVPEARLVAVADVDATAAHDVADRAGARSYQDHTDLLASDGVDAVLIATTTQSHVPIVRDAAHAGMDVFCEKPLALSREGCEEAVGAAEAAGVRLQVGLYRRFDADYRRARERIASGAIGRPQLVRSIQYDTFVPPSEFCAPAVSGGIAVDMGIHEFDIVAWLLGEDIVEVHAYGGAPTRPALRAVGDVDACVTALRFGSGALGSVELLRDVGYAEEVRTEVVGTAGSVLIGSVPWSSSAYAREGVLALDLPTSVFDRFRPALVAQLRAFCRAVFDDTGVEVGGRDSIAGLAVGIAARESLELGRPVVPVRGESA